MQTKKKKIFKVNKKKLSNRNLSAVKKKTINERSGQIKNKIFKKMSRLNSVCAVILLITYIQFCSTKKVIEDFDARTTENYNTQTSEEWFDPMKQKLIPTVEDALRLLSPDGRGDNEKEDKIGVEDSSDTSTIQIQDQTKASSLDSKYETTDVNGNESTTLTTISAQYTNVGGDVSVAAELFSNKQWKMFEPIRDAIAVPAQPLSENTIYQGTGSDQILSVNSSSVSNSTSTDELSANQNLTTTTPKPSNTPTHARTKFRQIQTSKPKIFKYNAEDVLQRFLDDAYIRKPMAALIDTSPNVLRKTKLLWKSALRPNSPLDIVLVAFNSSGKPFLYTRNFLNHFGKNNIHHQTYHSIMQSAYYYQDNEK